MGRSLVSEAWIQVQAYSNQLCDLGQATKPLCTSAPHLYTR